MLTTIAQAIVVGYLPGAVAFHLPVLDRDRRAALDPAERLFWQIVLSLAWSLSVVMALAVAGRYSVERLIVLNAATVVLLAAAARLRLRLGPAARRRTLWTLVPIVLALVASWRFSPPSEYIIGGKDPGTYINEGIQIAQRGAIVPADPVVASVPNFARDLFFPSHGRPDYYSSRFMGFFLVEPEQGHVVGQFPHLFPASIAIGYGLDGLTGARRATGFWAVLGVLAVYFAGARVLGRLPAAAAAALLTTHLIEVWFGRYPNAEVVMQALLFAALLASARAHVDDDPFFAPVAGWLLGLLLFLRFDAVLAVAGVCGGLALGALAGQRLRATFVLVFGPIAALAVWYLLGPMYAYVYLPIVFLSNLQWWQYAAIAIGGALALTAVLLGSRNRRLTADVRHIVPRLVAGVVLVAAVYALWFRHPGGKLTDYDAYALRTFTSLYFTLPAVLAALGGFALAARTRFWRDPSFFLTSAIFAMSVFYKIRIVPEHFWMARRFLPVILPAALLFVCSLAIGGAPGTGRIRRALRTALGSLFLVLLGLHYARVTQPVERHVEYAGIIPKLEQLAALVHDDDLLIVESRDASDTHVLALPLAYIYDRHVLVLASRLPDKSVFESFLEWAHRHYGRVLFIGGGGTDLLSPKWTVQPIASDRFQVPEYEAARDVYPRFPRRKEFDYTVYAFSPMPSGGSASSLDIDLGIDDDLNVLRFHAKESDGERSFRWSRDYSFVSVASLPADVERVTLWLNDGGRPAAAGRAEVTVSLEYGYRAGQEPAASVVLGRVTPDASFRPYELAIPPDVVQAAADTHAPVRLRIATPPWVPRDTLGTNDDRDLGVMVDRVTFK